MFHGRNTGKKLNAMKIVEQAFDIINLMTDKNPLQVLVEAVSNAGPREDSTRIGTSGVVRRQAVDVSPFRRVSFALTLITQGVDLIETSTEIGSRSRVPQHQDDG